MQRLRNVWFVTILAALAAAGYFTYRRWDAAPQGRVVELVSYLPADAAAVAYLDAAALRDSPFFKGLLSLAPSQQMDADYTQFLQATGFNYERDLDRVTIAFRQRGPEKDFFALVEGRFDPEKIAVYALKSGTRILREGREIYSTPLSGSARNISLTFLGPNRLAITDGTDLLPYLKQPAAEDAAELRERALRLAGSPFFLILRQEALTSLARKAPTSGGLRFDQLPAILASLRWLTLGARPDADRMRFVLEGECASPDAARQMAQSVEGLLSLARIAVDDPKVRKEMNPAMREAVVETLKSADVSRINRGETTSVRLALELGPKILEAVRNSAPPA